MTFLLNCVALLFSVTVATGNTPLPNLTETVTNTVFLPVAVNNWPPLWDWQETETVEGIGSALGEIRSLFDNQGRLHLFWDSGTTGTPRFIYHAYRSSEGWVNAYPVANSIGISELEAKPVVDQDGVLHLLWANEVISGAQTVNRLLYAAFDGNSWGPEQELYRAEGSAVGLMQLDTQQRLNLYARDSAHYDQLQHAVRDSGEWIWQPPIDLPDRVDWIWPDSADGVRMYYGRSPTETVYSRWSQGEFAPLQQSIPGLDIRSRTNMLDGRNSFHVLWRAMISVPGDTVSAVHHQCLVDEQIPGVVEVPSGDSPTSGLIGGYDQEGWFTMAWFTEDGIQVALWNSCNWVGRSAVQPSEAFGISLRAVAADSKSRTVCVISRQFLDETHPVDCVQLR